MATGGARGLGFEIPRPENEIQDGTQAQVGGFPKYLDTPSPQQFSPRTPLEPLRFLLSRAQNWPGRLNSRPRIGARILRSPPPNWAQPVWLARLCATDRLGPWQVRIWALYGLLQATSVCFESWPGTERDVARVVAGLWSGSGRAGTHTRPLPPPTDPN